MTEDVSFQIVMIQAEVMKRGALPMWTVYNRPTDYRCGYVARMFEVGPGAKPKPTPKTIKCLDLDPIRDKLRNAGLTCIGREPADEPQIVETWL